MALVITNGKFYITYTESGSIRKTPDFEKAIVYDNIVSAVDDMRRSPGRTKNCYIYDTVTQKVCWKKLTNEEHQELRNRQKLRAKRKNFSNAARRRVYEKAEGRCQLCGKKILYEEMTLDHIVPLSMCGDDVESNLQCAARRRVYEKAEGRCQLCGKKILYEEMTLDHIVPLSMCGDDVESNLQCACRSCNELKKNILPEDFLRRVANIFCFQMQKKHGKSFQWKIICKLLKGMLEEV